MHAPDGSVLAAALALPADERAELTLHLLDSLDEGVHEDAEAAWDKEIARRVTALETGQAKLIPLEEAMSRAHARVRAIRG